MVALDGQGRARRDHAADQAQDAGGVGAAADQVARVHRAPAVGVERVALADPVAEAVQQRAQLLVAAVDVTDHVERAALPAAVGRARDPPHGHRVDLLGGGQDHDAREALGRQAVARAQQQGALGAADGGAHRPGPAGPVPRRGDPGRQVEQDRDRRDVVLGRERHQRRAREGRTLVASTTVSRPRASRRATIRCSTSNASSDAAWSAGSSATSARHASEETTSVGRKCRAASVLLPAPAVPTSTTSARSGTTISTTGRIADPGERAQRPPGRAPARRRQRRAGAGPPGRRRRGPARPSRSPGSARRARSSPRRSAPRW